MELLTVVLILGVLSVGLSGRFSSSSSFQTMATRDDIVAGLFYAQQIAMARDSASNNVQFVSTANSFDILEAGTSIGNGIYPVTLPSGFSLTAVTLNYDKLGRTSATTLTLSDGSSSATINVSETGYAE